MEDIENQKDEKTQSLSKSNQRLSTSPPPPPSSWKELALLSTTMFFCFGIHNLLQEAIMNTPGFSYGMMLGYLEVLGVAVCSYLDRRYIAKEKGRVAPIKSYFFLTVCLMASSALSNASLNFINFPTKVIFRSCKLIPTMVIATVINKRIFSTIEYICAFFISVGLIVFTVVDWQLAPVFHPLGIIFVSISVCADAILPNMQEKLFRIGSSRLEVTFFTNLFTFIMMTFTSLISGDMINLFKLVLSDQNQNGSGMLTIYIVVYTFISYVAVSSFMLIVKKYGGVTAVFLGTARKAMTLVLSFCFFPKAFSFYYVLGTIFVLGGLLVGSLAKQRKKVPK